MYGDDSARSRYHRPAVTVQPGALSGSPMVLVVLVRYGEGLTGLGCVAVDQQGCESWLVRQGFREGVGEWTKRYSDPTKRELQTAVATIVMKPLIPAGGF
jgi:hypothetical protein